MNGLAMVSKPFNLDKFVNTYESCSRGSSKSKITLNIFAVYSKRLQCAVYVRSDTMEPQ